MKSLAFGLAFLLTAGAAQAATVVYHYQGPDLLWDSSGPALIENIGAFAGTMTLDEDLLGQSLVNASIQMECGFDYAVGYGIACSPAMAGVIDFSIRRPPGWNDGPIAALLGPSAYSFMNLATDADRNLVGAWIWVMDGPPDYAFGAGDWLYAGGPADWNWSTDLPGVWTTVSVTGEPFVPAVPLPASLWLLAGALGLLARRK